MAGPQSKRRELEISILPILSSVDIDNLQGLSKPRETQRGRDHYPVMFPFIESVPVTVFKGARSTSNLSALLR